MLIVACSAIDWKFTTVVFPKFYWNVAHHIVEWEIICVKWKLSLKPEMREISLEAEQVKRATISQLREAAKTEWLFWEEESSDSTSQAAVSSEKEKIDKEISEEEPTISQLFPSLDTQFVCDLEGNTLVMKLSKETSRETLLEIKNILESFPLWKYHVWLDIAGQRIDTKKSIFSLIPS
jgi:hypothetical protein